ncbi:hypothetical protein ACLB2K_067042 [Fragaria x ananassa]
MCMYTTQSPFPTGLGIGITYPELPPHGKWYDPKSGPSPPTEIHLRNRKPLAGGHHESRTLFASAAVYLGQAWHRAGAYSVHHWDMCTREKTFFTLSTSHPPYLLHWDQSIEPPSANWTDTNIHITNFWLAMGEMQIMSYTARDCYDQKGEGTYQNSPELTLIPPYTISAAKNTFIAVGCDTYAIFTGYQGEQRYITGCMSLCNSLESVDESFSGVGCCQTSIPSGMKNRTVTLSSYYNHSDIWSFNPCSYAFIVQEGHFSFSNTSFQELSVTEQVPMVLDWAIGNEPDPCDAAERRQDFACNNNSKCVNHDNRNGYVCECFPGYEPRQSIPPEWLPR